MSRLTQALRVKEEGGLDYEELGPDRTLEVIEASRDIPEVAALFNQALPELVAGYGYFLIPSEDADLIMRMLRGEHVARAKRELARTNFIAAHALERRRIAGVLVKLDAKLAELTGERDDLDAKIADLRRQLGEMAIEEESRVDHPFIAAGSHRAKI